MLSSEIRQRFLDFFKKRGHKIIPSSSLIPDDPTVLFTSAGMQQLTPYLAGEKDVIEKFGTHHLASVQKCFRSNDIEEVGDDTHHTFFEMLGNWSVGTDEKGEYFKEGAIRYAIEFFEKEIGLSKERFYITIFKGEGDIPRDEESFKIWQKYGIKKERIKEFGMEDNFWGPVAEEGPCGPCSEIHYDRGEEFGCQRKDCGPNCPYCNRFVELWNLVFMEYEKKGGKYQKLSQTNVDTGIGLERLTAVLQKKSSAYETDLFEPIIKQLETLSSFTYADKKREFRIIADHIRGAVFLIADGVLPSNIERGYILRRILRRSFRYARILNLKENWYIPCIEKITQIYKDFYPEIKIAENKAQTIIQNEDEKFRKALSRGILEFEKLIQRKKEKDLKIIEGKEAFDLYQTFGFPIELISEMAKEKGFSVDFEGFEKEKRRHQEISRKGAERKFGGHGIEKVKEKEAKEKIKKLHTATHLLHSALRKVLGEEVRQMGSDITPERLRFDFSFSRKLEKEEIEKIERLVNEKIKENLKVKKEKMPLKEALASGALAFFKEKYPDVVTVYTIYNEKTGEVFSKEICGGPHVKETGELGKFKILKEKSKGSGIRRIKAILE